MKHRLTLMSGVHPSNNNEVGDFNDARTAHLVGGLLMAIDANNAPEYRGYDVATVSSDRTCDERTRRYVDGVGLCWMEDGEIIEVDALAS